MYKLKDDTVNPQQMYLHGMWYKHDQIPGIGHIREQLLCINVAYQKVNLLGWGICINSKQEVHVIGLIVGRTGN